MKSIIFEANLARRFLEENKTQTLLIVLGIAIGVAVMVFLAALIDGLQASLIDNTIGNSPHIVISSADDANAGALKMLNGDQVLAVDTRQTSQRPMAEWRIINDELTADTNFTTVLPVVEGSAIIKRGQVSKAVLLRGFDLNTAEHIYEISKSMTAGESRAGVDSVLIGKDLASDLGISAGDPILLEITGQNPRPLMVAGVFDLGVSAVNQRWLIMDQHQAANLLSLGDRVTSIEIQVKEVFQAENLARSWSDRLPGCKVESWQETNASLLTALKSQSNSSYTIQFFVLLAVILGVASVLAINAMQKSKQIGILKAIGIRTSSVARVFMFQGMALGLMGSAAGFFIGLLMSQAFIALGDQQFGLLLKPLTMLVIFITTIIAATLSAYIPARSVSRLNPIEVIRNG